MPSEYLLHGQTRYSWQDPSAVANLRLAQVPKPTDIPAGHALVRIRAAALNARDIMVRVHAAGAHERPADASAPPGQPARGKSQAYSHCSSCLHSISGAQVHRSQRLQGNMLTDWIMIYII